MSRIISLVVFFLIFIGLDFYLYRVFRVHFMSRVETLRWFTIIWFSVPAICALLALLNPLMGRDGKLWVMNIVMIVFFAVLLSSILIFIGDIARMLLNNFSKPADEVLLGRRKFIANLGAVLLAIPLGTMFWGLLKTAYNFKIHRITVKFPNLPEAFHGFRFVQLSDIHTGSFLKRGELGEAIRLTLMENADAIFFTGDLVNNRTDEAYPFRDILSKLHAPYGVYSTLGNHDYGDYERWPDTQSKVDNMKAMYALHEELGWRLLNNDHAILEKNGDKIAIVGVENWGAAFRFPKNGDVTKAKLGTENVPFKILLSHDPSHWEAQVIKDHTDIDLMLAGHTHGFQFGVEIPGLKWSPSQYLYKQWAGLYQHGNQFIYVNRGLGCLGYSGRVGIRPEITVIELQRG